MDAHSLESDLLGRLERVAFEPELWPDVLDRLAHAFRATVFALRTMERGVPAFIGSERTEEIGQAYYRNDWESIDLRAIELSEAPTMTLLTDEDLVSAEVRARSPFYTDFARRMGVTHLTAWRFKEKDNSFAFAINRPVEIGRLDEGERRSLERIMPAATNAALLSARAAEAINRRFGDLIEASDLAIILVSSFGRVLFVSANAEKLFGPSFQVRNGELICRDCVPADALVRLRQALREPGPSPAVDSFMISNQPGKRILCLPMIMSAPGRDIFQAARGLLILRDLNAPYVADRNAMMRLLAFTPSEAEVAVLLASGKSVNEIAVQRSVSAETVRAMLKSAFAKTGARSQAELVSLVIRATLVGAP